MKMLLDKVLRLLTAGSPRLVCTHCDQGFLLASINVNVSRKGFKDLCPRCGEPGPFRAASAEESAAIAPERWHWWGILPAICLMFYVFFLVAWSAIKWNIAGPTRRCSRRVRRSPHGRL